MATAIVVARAVASPVSNRFEFGAGNHDRTLLILVRPASTPVTGVR